MAYTLKVNDKVKVISGALKGTEAKIVKIEKETHKAMLEGVKTVERHLKKSYLNPTGGKKTVHLGIDLSNLKLVESAKFEKKAKKVSEKAEKTAKTEIKAKKGAK